MVLSLALKPQLHAHIENSVRTCMLEHSSEPHPLRLSESSISVLPSPSVPGVKSSGRPLSVEISADEARGVKAAAATAGVPVQQPAATPGETGAAEAPGTPTEVRQTAGGSANSPRVTRLPAAPPMQNNDTPELHVQAQAPHEGATDGNSESRVSSKVDSSASTSADADGRSEAAEAGNTAAAPPTESRGPTTANSVVSSPKEAPDASTAGASPAQPASLPEVPRQADAAVQLEPGTQLEQAKTPQPQDNQNVPQLPAPTHDLEIQRLAVEAAQRAAVQESNAVVVTVLVLASVALVFELYLVYACWSFKVWMERGYESVVLAGECEVMTTEGWSPQTQCTTEVLQVFDRAVEVQLKWLGRVETSVFACLSCRRNPSLLRRGRWKRLACIRSAYASNGSDGNLWK